MAEYIDKSAVLAKIDEIVKQNLEHDLPNDLFDLAILSNVIMKMPAADVAPVVHGHWILEREPNGKPYCFHCSACDEEFRRINIYTKYNYCPDCGAKMDEEVET